MRHRIGTSWQAVLGAVTAAVVLSAWWVHLRFTHEIAEAAARAAQGSRIVSTRCGPIEVQESGAGRPLLVIHGSGGGHDQGMAFARDLVPPGTRVIAPSRFGYLRTPRPADASPSAQADAHVCLLDALGIDKVAVLGVSAGGPSAMLTAIRHPDRVTALALIVPLAPARDAAHTEPTSAADDSTLLRLLGSDFLFWSALKLARGPVFRYVLATPPELIAAATAAERERVNAVANQVLPVSLRAAGLRDDTGLGRRMPPMALETIRVPTLIASARDDGFGTFDRSQYTASRISGARLIGFDTGGHLLVGRQDALRAALAEWLAQSAS